MSHTILLVQPTKKPEGRTYSDYESVNECMEGMSVLACDTYYKCSFLFSQAHQCVLAMENYALYVHYYDIIRKPAEKCYIYNKCFIQY